MFNRYPFIRVLRCAAIALFVAMALAGIGHIIVPGLSGLQSQIVAILVCASVVFLLTFGLLKPDVTERKRTEEMLQHSETKYRVLFEDSADATWLMDEKGFLDCNSAALQMFGYAIGTPMLHPAEISPPSQPDGTNSRTAAERKIAAAFLNGNERFEWLHQRKNGSTFPAEVSRHGARHH